MSKEESLYSKKDLKKLTIELVITNVISIVLSVFFCFNSALPLAGIGISKYQIQIAYESRLTGDFSESVKWYKKLANKGNKYSPYAYLSIAEIYSSEVGVKRYEEAFQNYRNAEANSDDIIILNLCMNFIVQQIDLFNSGQDEDCINLLDDEHVDFIVDVMNKISEVSPSTFSCLNIEFPLNKNDVVMIFDVNQTLNKTVESWEYISTKITEKPGLQFVGDDKKRVLVRQWAEPSGCLDGTMIVWYKYYDYEKVIETLVMPSLDAISSVFEYEEKLFLGQSDFKDRISD